MNGQINGHIIAAAVIIGGAGLLNAYTSGKPVYRVLVGAGIWLVLMAILDTFGGDFSTLASALAMLAVVYVLLNVFPWHVLTSMLSTRG